MLPRMVVWTLVVSVPKLAMPPPVLASLLRIWLLVMVAEELVL